MSTNSKKIDGRGDQLDSPKKILNASFDCYMRNEISSMDFFNLMHDCLEMEYTRGHATGVKETTDMFKEVMDKK